MPELQMTGLPRVAADEVGSHNHSREYTGVYMKCMATVTQNGAQMPEENRESMEQHSGTITLEQNSLLVISPARQVLSFSE